MSGSVSVRLERQSQRGRPPQTALARRVERQPQRRSGRRGLAENVEVDVEVAAEGVDAPRLGTSFPVVEGVELPVVGAEVQPDALEVEH